MTARSTVCLVLLGAGLICQPPRGSAQDARAKSLWQTGQAALKRGNHEQAIACFEESLKMDPSFVRPHLSLAAVYLEQGDERAALPHLARYVQANPAHLIVRAHYAELLLRLQMFHEACTQFEQFVAQAQDDPKTAPTLLIQSHSKLMEIAEAAEDEYSERLHRGIGMYLLACERTRLPDPEGLLSTEGLLCRAVQELKQALAQRPDEARPQWYLYLTWSRMAQHTQAVRALRQAGRAAAFSYLTPAEEHEMELACRQLENEHGIGSHFGK